MPFSDFERRADEVVEGLKRLGQGGDTLDARLLIKDLLFEIRRLNNKLGDIRRVLDAGETAGDYGKRGLSSKIERARRAADD